MARKRRHKPGDLARLRRVLWDTLLRVEALQDDPECPAELVLRAAHAVAQLAGAYTKILELTELERRVAALEEAYHGRLAAAR